MQQKPSSSDPLGALLAFLVVVFALYTMHRMPDLMSAMDRATNLTP